MENDVLVESIIEQYNHDPANLIMVLQDIQARLNYLPAEVIEQVAERLSLPKSHIYSIATFFKSFSLQPLGKHKINICEGTACHIRGASLLMSSISDEFKVKPGQTTTDGQFTLNSVHCIGACAMGPVAIIDGEYHGNMTSAKLAKLIGDQLSSEKEVSLETPSAEDDSVIARLPHKIEVHSLEDYEILKEQIQMQIPPDQPRILVCTGTGCLARGSIKVAAALEKELDAAGMGLPVTVGLKKIGCHGLCEKGPLVIFHPSKLCYTRVAPEDACAIVRETVVGGKVIDRLLYSESPGKPSIEKYTEIPFYASQKKVALRHVGLIDPLDIGDYIAHDGYRALVNVLNKMQPEEVIAEVESSRLRGRGGGGFPTGLKWRSAVSVDADTRYVICNGDEGDPGAFMDCSIMEGDPHAVIEGMLICAYAIQASRGYIYVREEYPRALKRMRLALEQAYRSGFLGSNICGTLFSFDIKIIRGAGAFVCGESTALMQSVEGKVGEPRAKYIRSAERGLYNRPTVLNNVETYANIPIIIENGADWFTSFGSENSKGTKVFSVVGKVKNTGLVEVPMGTTLRSIIYELCGGILDDKKFKAVQTGGPSGGCLPAEMLNLPIDFDTLTREGSMMGSGGMIVMDENTCMVDVARYFTDFLTRESCGKCAACRLGLEQLHVVLVNICRGEGRSGDLEIIEKLLDVLEKGSLCGLGKSAPNPVRSTLTHFKNEYLAHIENKKCPAGVCRDLISYEINEQCTGCRRCLRLCPQNAISGEKKELHFIDQNLCNRCGICKSVCNFNAISVR